MKKRILLSLCYLFILASCTSHKDVVLESVSYQLASAVVKYQYTQENPDYPVRMVFSFMKTAEEIMIAENISIEEAHLKLKDVYAEDMDYFSKLVDVDCSNDNGGVIVTMKNEDNYAMTVNIDNSFLREEYDSNYYAGYTIIALIDFSANPSQESLVQVLDFFGVSKTSYDENGVSLTALKEDKNFKLNSLFTDGILTKMDVNP